MAVAVEVMDRCAQRRMSDDLHAVDEALHRWARLKRQDGPPNGWPTEWPPERWARGPRSTAPAEVPQWFIDTDAAVAKCTDLERKVLFIRYVRFPDATKRFQRGRLNMSEGKWDRTLRAARNTVAAWI